MVALPYSKFCRLINEPPVFCVLLDASVNTASKPKHNKAMTLIPQPEECNFAQ